MTPVALRGGWLVVALQLRCVTMLVIPRDGGAAAAAAAKRADLDAPKLTGDRLDELFHQQGSDLSRGPVVAPRKKAPQFMLDLYNAVSVSGGAPKSQKDILEGNTVRSFEDKGA